MCEFCKNIKTQTDYEALEPYLIFENSIYHIEAPFDDGVVFAINGIKYCPMCGEKL